MTLFSAELNALFDLNDSTFISISFHLASVNSFIFEANACRLELVILQSKNLKISKRYAYLFEGQIILVKINPYTVQAAAPKSKSSKFKQKILLARCHLVDRVDDECCFELQQLTNGGGRYTRTDEYTLFILDTQKDKFHWMAMLCYTQYKFTFDRLLQIMIEEHNHLNPLPIPPKSYIFY